ncbi:MAG: carboxylate--amine ligase [candidate division KSB1 bacterium]|nr:carboxylate--amine ligase [candidate division KSB1 bacterium]
MKTSTRQEQLVEVPQKAVNPPVIILGGTANALSIARSMGRSGVDVVLAVGEKSPAQYSRYATEVFIIPGGTNPAEFWHDWLLSGRADRWHGSVIFACNDEAVEFVAQHKYELAEHFLLDDSVPELQLALLDKQRTLEMAREVGVPTPNFWRIYHLDDLDRVRDRVTFPVIIKPIHSHLFRSAFGKKLFYAFDKDELVALTRKALNRQIEVMIMEWVPGPDHLLGSYYTYIDRDDRALFHYTKKVVRRFPVNQGLACYHYTEWDEEIAELGQTFFRGIHFRGLGNIEFKRDLRDGLLKVIECNPRFTAAQELLARSGMDAAKIIYNAIVGKPVPNVESYRQKLHFWYPVRDFRAFLQLRRRGELTFAEWLKSIGRKQVFPYFRWDDPMPSIRGMIRGLTE